MTQKKSDKRIKKEKIQTEEQAEIARFVKILLIVLAFVVVIYFFTRIFVTKDLINKKESTPTAGSIDYNTTLIGNMLSKTEEEYYVIMYNTEDIKSVSYSGIVSNYKRNKEPLKVYFADLNNGLNEKYIAKDNEQINVNTTNFSEFKVRDLALLKISNGKIVNSYTTKEDIERELAYQKSTN